MKNKTQLSVRPVRKSEKPGYPSWQEPNPLEQPYAQPYPFTQKAINWLAASGLCGALFLMPEAEGVAKQVDRVEAMVGDTLGNPFPFNRMGVPFHTSAFGTGLPERITGKEAKAIIDSVFRAEGFYLEKKVVKAADGYVELDGYDANKDIGYVWIGWERMAYDMAIPWRNQRDLKSQIKQSVQPKRQADREIASYSKSIKKIHEAFAKDKYASNARKEFAKQLKLMLDNGQPDWADNYRFLFYEYTLKERLESHEKYQKGKFPTLINYMQSVLKIKDVKKRNKELDKAMDVLNSIKIYQNWLFEVLIRIVDNRSYNSKLKRLVRLQEAYRNIGYYDSTRQEEIKQLIMNGKNNWKYAERQVEVWEDEINVSLDEAWALEGDAYKNGKFVALISQRDDRLIYSTTKKWVDDMRESGRFFYKRDHPYADSLEIERNIERMYGKPDYSGTKEAVLQNLEKQVLDYIRWAKQQRGY